MRCLLLTALLPTLVLCAPQLTGLLESAASPLNGGTEGETSQRLKRAAEIPTLTDYDANFHCNSTPNILFTDANKKTYPVYNCTNGPINVWMVSENFRRPEPDVGAAWIKEADIQLPEQALRATYAGDWDFESNPRFFFSSSVKLASPNVNVRGLSITRAPFLKKETTPFDQLGVFGYLKKIAGALNPFRGGFIQPYSSPKE